jgi:hypothetical protein
MGARCPDGIGMRIPRRAVCARGIIVVRANAGVTAG